SALPFLLLLLHCWCLELWLLMHAACRVGQVEAQATGQGRSLGQLHRNDIAEFEAPVRPVSDQRVGSLVVLEELSAQRADRDEPLSPAFRDAHEQAEARHAGDA